MADREITGKMGLVNLDIADVPFGYNERVEFHDVMRQNLLLIDSSSFPVTNDATYWVDAVNGSDSNNGLAETSAFKTIQFALDSIPMSNRALTTINVKRGVYNETLSDGHMYLDDGTFNDKILVTGVEFDHPVITGPLSGTLSSNTGDMTRTVVETVGNLWTSGSLRGFFVKMTSGTRSGTLYPIAGNDTGSLEIPQPASSLNNATFEIVLPAATIVRKSSNQFAAGIIGNAGATISNGGLVLQNFRVTSSSSYGFYIVGNFNVLGCYFKGHTSYACYVANAKAQVSVDRCYMEGASAGINGNEIHTLNVGGNVIHGASGAGIQAGSTVHRLSAGANGHNVIQSCGRGLDFISGPTYIDSFSSQKFILRNNTGDGARLENSFHSLMQFWTVVGNGGHGINFRASDQLIGHNSINCFSSRIQGNVGDGIHIETPFNVISLGSATNISDNGGAGVKLTTVNATPTHNNIWVGSSVTMTSNTGSDIVLGAGGLTTTIANLRAGGKILFDSGSFNVATAA